MIKRVRIEVEGMHCQGCQTRIESTVGALQGVKKVHVDYADGLGWVEFDDAQVGLKKIFKTIGALDYRVQRAPDTPNATQGLFVPQRWLVAGGLLIAFALAYWVLNRVGGLQLLARLNERNLGYGLIFVIGLLASFHCVAMCGGLVVTYTAGQRGDGGNALPHLQYNLGRVISYTAIGAILGGFGSFFAISPAVTGAVTLIAGAFMLLMGLSLLTEWRWLGSLGVHMPDFVGRFLYGNSRSQSPKGPFIIGLLNGLMPCGPLQAMQLYALTTGSAARGALSMAVYALGTVPMMFGFGSVISMLSRERTRQVVRVSGALVIALGVLMLVRGMDSFQRPAALPLASGQPTAVAALAQSAESASPTATAQTDVQVVHMKLTRRGYEPNTLHAKVGVPVRWEIDVVEMTNCTNRLILPEYGISKSFEYGLNVIEFTPTHTGELPFSCWMKMVWGKFLIEA